MIIVFETSIDCLGKLNRLLFVFLFFSILKLQIEQLRVLGSQIHRRELHVKMDYSTFPTESTAQLGFEPYSALTDSDNEHLDIFLRLIELNRFRCAAYRSARRTSVMITHHHYSHSLPLLTVAFKS